MCVLIRHMLQTFRREGANFMPDTVYSMMVLISELNELPHLI